MRKLMILPIVLLITLEFGSCKYSGSEHEGDRDNYKAVYSELGKERWDWDDSEGDECALKVIDCFINKDSEALKEMFCSRAKKGVVIDEQIVSLDEQIEGAFEFIKGNIISYDDHICSMDEVAYDEGKVTRRYYGPIIDDIKTDEKRTYTISINLYTVFDEDEGRVGITSLTVRENEDNAYRVGLPST